jgi:hypothetical protein
MSCGTEKLKDIITLAIKGLFLCPCIEEHILKIMLILYNSTG